MAKTKYSGKIEHDIFEAEFDYSKTDGRRYLQNGDPGFEDEEELHFSTIRMWLESGNTVLLKERELPSSTYRELRDLALEKGREYAE